MAVFKLYLQWEKKMSTGISKIGIDLFFSSDMVRIVRADQLPNKLYPGARCLLPWSALWRVPGDFGADHDDTNSPI